MTGTPPQYDAAPPDLALGFDGYDDKDIAYTLNITPESVRSHRRHARSHLAHHLDPLIHN